MSERYEPCVTNAEGNCTRWSHNHDAPEATDPTPGEVRLSDEEDAALAEWWVSEGGDYEDLAIERLTDAVERIVAARLAARDAVVALCSQCGEMPSVMVKLGTTDGWCTRCLDEAAERAEAAEAEVADLRATKAELGRVVTEWMLWGAQRRHAWQSARRRAADLRAKVERVEALADEWDEEGPSLVRHAHSGADVFEGEQLQRCARSLRAALGGEQ